MAFLLLAYRLQCTQSSTYLLHFRRPLLAVKLLLGAVYSNCTRKSCLQKSYWWWSWHMQNWWWLLAVDLRWVCCVGWDLYDKCSWSVWSWVLWVAERVWFFSRAWLCSPFFYSPKYTILGFWDNSPSLSRRSFYRFLSLPSSMNASLQCLGVHFRGIAGRVSIIYTQLCRLWSQLSDTSADLLIFSIQWVWTSSNFGLGW